MRLTCMLLLAMSTSVHAIPWSRDGSIGQSIAEADVKQCEKLLKSDKSLAKKVFDTGSTPLHYACFLNGRTTLGSPQARINAFRIATLLLANGADVNAKNKDGQTPLYWAVMHGDIELCVLLKRYGATKQDNIIRENPGLMGYARRGEFIYFTEETRSIRKNLTNESGINTTIMNDVWNYYDKDSVPPRFTKFEKIFSGDASIPDDFPEQLDAVVTELYKAKEEPPGTFEPAVTKQDPVRAALCLLRLRLLVLQRCIGEGKGVERMKVRSPNVYV